MAEQDTNAIMLLDSDSRLVIKTSISVFGNHGIRFIENLDEITDDLVKFSHNVVVLEGFMKTTNCISDLELYKELYEINFFFLGSSKFFETLEGVAYCFECDLASLDVNDVQSAIYKDSTQMTSGAHDYFNYVKEAQEIVDHQGDYKRGIVDVAKSYLAMNNIHETLSREKSDLQKSNSRLLAENANLRNSCDRLINSYKSMIGDAKRLNKSLRRYEAIFSQDVYEKVRLHDYDHKPLVLYFKEYEDFIGLDSFVETLVSVFKLQDRKSVKVIRLFDSSTSRKILTVPSYYKVIHNRYLMSEVIDNEFVCKSGDYKRLLDKVLLNEIGLDVLIVVDSKDYEDLVISGTTAFFNLCREPEHAKAFGLPEKNTLVNFGDSNSENYWTEFDTAGMSNNEKMIYLSSKPAIRNILEMSRMFAQAL